jgi:hypothetical protein
MTTLYSEYGIQYAGSNRSTFRPQWGVTFDTITGGTGDLATVRDLVGGDPQDGWVRIVFDRKKSPSYYANEIAAAHQAGLRVVGQFLDSSDMAKVSMRAWKSRVRAYVSALPTVDEWEVGNEVNGNWLGRDVVSKITYAANYVKTHTSARTLLTLYWQLGEDNAAHSMYTWAKRNLSSSLLSQIDDIGISLYPEDHPMGVTFDRAFSTLHSLFPSQRIEITELGYWDTGPLTSAIRGGGDHRRMVPALAGKPWRIYIKQLSWATRTRAAGHTGGITLMMRCRRTRCGPPWPGSIAR